MKILLVNFSDVGGGAAIAAFRLAEALNGAGIEATLGVVQKRTASPFVVEIPKKKKSWFVRKLNRVIKIFDRLFRIFLPHIARLSDFHSTNNILHSKNLESIVDVDWINAFECDVVNLHWGRE